MISDTVVEFADFLNKKGYIITADKIAMVLRSIEDISSMESMEAAIKPYFCSKRQEYDNMNDYFKEFVKNRKKIIEAERLKKEKETAKKIAEDTKNKLNEEISEIDKRVLQKSKEAMEKLKDQGILDQKDRKFMIDNQKEILALPFTMIPMTLIKGIIYTIINGAPVPTMPGAAKAACVEITTMSEEALLSGNKEKFQMLKTLNDICKKLQKIDIDKEKKVRESIKDATKDLTKKKKELQQKMQTANMEYEKIQDKLDMILAETEYIVVKNASISHREEFIGGKRAVQLIGDGLPEIMETKFSSMDDVMLMEVYSYILKNMLKFKTRLQKSINSQMRKEIDMEKTIQLACKTGGLPMELINKQPKANRAKLLMCLDISGSCKEASKMMLSFMYLLKSVFPAGCKTYVFVNQLHDISKIMNTNNILTAVEGVLNTIPTRGVYSNYYKPLTQLWIEHKSEITPETFVIFIGDARNNKNNTGDEYIKNISRRAKKCIWLNTDEREEWGQGDSIAPLYNKYSDMFEVLNPAQLIGAINMI